MKKNTNEHACRESVIKYAAERYGVQPENLWAKFPNYAVLRHDDNRKWFAVIMDVKREKLGLSGEGNVDILELKCDPVMAGSLVSADGVLPAYHMHRGSWITVLLDGSTDNDFVFPLLDMSFDITRDKKARKSSHGVIKREWLVPANPKYYDVEKAFSESDVILWKQSSNILVGDIVYLYVAAPVSAVMYKCEAVEVDIPYRYSDENLRIRRTMRIRLLHRFREGELSFNKLKEHGVYAVRGPRGVPQSLHDEMEMLCRITDQKN